MKMHEDEVDISASIVERLIAAQYPELAGLPIQPVRSTGTVNAIFRLGDTLCVRLPRVHTWADSLEREWSWLPRLAPHLTLRVPQPVAMGAPTSGYPFIWAIYRWIDGEAYADDRVEDERDAARTLAAFVTELRAAEPGDAPPGGRQPLRELDPVTREAIDAARDMIDRAAALAAWSDALEAPAWDGRSVWIHADLLRPNLLVKDGRLTAVIDFGSAGVGDPAADVIPAWSVFGPMGRETYRGALDVDDGTWRRARGYALHQAARIIPYYAQTNPGFVAMAKRTVKQVVADL